VLVGESATYSAAAEDGASVDEVAWAEPASTPEMGVIQRDSPTLTGFTLDVTALDTPGTVTLTAVAMGDDQECMAELEVAVYAAEFIAPIDANEDGAINDPATAANNFQGNEFTFSEADPGVLTLPVVVKVLPDTPTLRQALEGAVLAAVDPIGTSHQPGGEFTQLAWNKPSQDDPRMGEAVWLGAGLWGATAELTGLPMNNSDFGPKTVAVTAQNMEAGISLSLQTEIEVFYPKFARNHPGPDQTPPLAQQQATGNPPADRAPNWFHYWNQTPAGSSNALYYNQEGTLDGLAPAGFYWENPNPYPKNAIWIQDGAADADVARGLGGPQQPPPPVEGIDLFANIVLHELRHTVQFDENDNALGPLNGMAGTVWASGWSFKQIPDNHWALGPDGQPGVAGVDDDMDGEIDEMTDLSELGFGDDVDLDVNTNDIYDGLPYNADNSIEEDASRAETVADDTFWQLDWGDPGKQHKTDMKHD